MTMIRDRTNLQVALMTNLLNNVAKNIQNMKRSDKKYEVSKPNDYLMTTNGLIAIKAFPKIAEKGFITKKPVMEVYIYIDMQHIPNISYDIIKGFFENNKKEFAKDFADESTNGAVKFYYHKIE